MKETQVSIMGDLATATRKHRDETIKLWNEQVALTKQYEKQKVLAKETLEIRAAAFLKAETVKPPTGMLGQLGGETTED